MTTPRALRLPAVDYDKLLAEVDRQLEGLKAKGIEGDVLTGAQAKLSDLEKERGVLEELQRSARAEAAKTRVNIEALTRLLRGQEAYEADVTMQLGAVLSAAHSLRESGVTI